MHPVLERPNGPNGQRGIGATEWNALDSRTRSALDCCSLTPSELVRAAKNALCRFRGLRIGAHDRGTMDGRGPKTMARFVEFPAVNGSSALRELSLAWFRRDDPSGWWARLWRATTAWKPFPVEALSEPVDALSEPVFIPFRVA